MQEKVKKPSLFKQRMTAMKKEKQAENGFPKPIKLIEQKAPQQQILESQQAERMEEKWKKGLNDLIKSQSILKQEDMKKISSENWAKVAAMSQEQRANMVHFIKKEMNPDFIEKVSKSQEARPSKFQKQQMKESSKPEQNEQSNESWLSCLKFNVQANKIDYSEERSEFLINVWQLSEMIGSQNNQSQIVGSKIASKLVQHLQKLATSKQRELIFVNHVPLHLSIILEKCSTLLFFPMLKKARSTTFKSAFVEIVASSAEILQKIKKYLSKSSVQIFAKHISALQQKILAFQMDQQSSTAIRTSLKEIQKFYENSKNKIQIDNLSEMTKDIDVFLELILIEQGQSSFDNTYASNMIEFISKSVDLDEIIEAESFVFELINKLVLRRNRQLYISIQVFRSHWKPVVDSIVILLISKVMSLKLECLFKLVFLARFVGDTSWEVITSSLSQLSHIKPMLPHFILFNTLSDQKSGTIQSQNIESLNSVMSWLGVMVAENKIDPNYILNTIVQLFLQQQQYYSLLDQLVLQRLIVNISKSKLTNFDSVLSEQKVRTILNNYNYNSFGNQNFTILLLFAAIKCRPEIQSMILRQSIIRYLDNFIKIKNKEVRLEQIVGSKLLWQLDVKTEIQEAIEGREEEKNSLFLDYLRR